MPYLNPHYVPPIFRLQMLSKEEGWALGMGMEGPAQSFMLHYHQGNWSLVTTGLSLLDFSMLSASEGWAVGEQGTIAHFQQGQWVRVSSPTRMDLSTVQMVSARAGWATGDSRTAHGPGGQLRLTLLQYTSAGWTQVGLPSQLATGLEIDPFPGDHGVPMVFFERASFPSSSEGWMVGGSISGDPLEQPFYCAGASACVPGEDRFERSIIWHYIGGQWQMVSSE